jgi:DNA-binding response OmpR family regulator
MHVNNSFVLTIDRDQSYANSLEFALRDEGFAYRHFNNYQAAQPCLNDPNCSAVVIGRNLEGESGLQLAKILRNEPETSALIIILVAQRYDEYEVIESLDAGADDYMGKPLASKELVCRFKAILRRRRKPATEPKATFVSTGELILNEDDACATFGDKALKFTRSEFEILQCLAKTPERVFQREHLFALLSAGESISRNAESLRKIDVHIGRIRTELRKLENGPMILTVRGEGYFYQK